MPTNMRSKLCAVLIAAPMLAVTSASAVAQDRDRHGNFYQGARDGGRGGGYDNDRNHHDDRYNQNRQGGIGPGKGAAIGAAGGAVLGTVFGGGLKGAIIGGAAGAGVGAIAGKEHQDNQRRQYYNGRPY